MSEAGSTPGSTPASQCPQTSGPAIRSTLSGNSDMAELIEWFVGHLSERTSDLRQAWSSHDIDRISVLAHQMKGSSAGYGFACLGEAAAKLEQAAKQQQAGATGDLSTIQRHLDELIELCSRVTL
jgi:HPt (histidine-containing phosphotransfer) domain-containing protein